jgi:hypothetical protein
MLVDFQWTTQHYIAEDKTIQISESTDKHFWPLKYFSGYQSEKELPS